MKRTGYDYIPSPGEDYYPQGKPAGEAVSGTVIGQDAVNTLIKDENGDLRVVDNKKVKK